MARRLEPTDLDTARQMVSRAERNALDRAEQLRQEAEDLLRAASAAAASPSPGPAAESVSAAPAAESVSAAPAAPGGTGSASPAPGLAAEADRLFQEAAAEAYRLFQQAATGAEERFAKIQSELEEARAAADMLLRETRTEVQQLLERSALAAAPAPADQGLVQELTVLRSTMDSLRETLERFMFIQGGEFSQGGERRRTGAVRTYPLTGQAQ